MQMSASTPQLPEEPIAANPVPATKQWHYSMTADFRSEIIAKLVQAIVSIPNPDAMLNNTMHNIIEYGKKIEEDMYQMANTRSEYYHLLAEKIYTIQRDFAEHR